MVCADALAAEIASSVIITIGALINYLPLSKLGSTLRLFQQGHFLGKYLAVLFDLIEVYSVGH